MPRIAKNKAVPHKKKPYERFMDAVYPTSNASPPTSAAPKNITTHVPDKDKTLMTVNGRAIRQTPDGRMYVMRNNKRIFI